MRILVTGGTGVVGRAAVTRLVERGHRVRLVSRGAERDVRDWPEGVEAWPASIADADALRGAADDCDAVLHLAGIVRERPPEVTFEDVNIRGTAHVLDEAARAGVARFVYVSSLGAERGHSAYHQSKRAAERLVERYPHAWSVCRLANVYGPGDAVISVVLRWMRSAPVLPVLDWGETEFQPIWVEDAAAALTEMVERDAADGRAVEVAGLERTCLADLVDRLATLVDRRPLTLPVPSGIATVGAWLGKQLGIDLPVDPGQITMLNEGSVIHGPEGNALQTLLGVTPTPLAEGLRQLADATPEQLPSEGVGALQRKRFALDVHDARLDAAALFAQLRARFAELTPWTMEIAPEPGTPTGLAEGMTVTMSLPLRGHIQVRVAELTATSLTMLTLEGHPLAGGIRIAAHDTGPQRLRLTITVYDRTAGLVDWLLMHPVGETLQARTWEQLLETLAEESGGRAAGDVHTEQRAVKEGEADEVEAWFAAIIRDRRQEARREPHAPEEEQHARRPAASPSSAADDRPPA